MLSKISQRQIMHAITYLWNQKRYTCRKEWNGGNQGLGNARHRREVLLKGYKLPVRRWVSSGNLVHDTVIKVKNIGPYS